MRPFAVYPGSFDGATLGYWRFGERGGLLADVTSGKVLTNVGAEARDDGYRFVAADKDYMTAAYADQPARSALTLECWVRDYGGAADEYHGFLRFSGPTTGGGANDVMLYARRRADPALSHIIVICYVDGVYKEARWTGQAVDDLLVASKARPFHVAAVRNGTALRLFVNGELEATNATIAATAFPAGDWTFYVGALGPITYNCSAVLDEVRLSAAARYAATFVPARFQEGERAGLRGPGEMVEVAGGVV